MLLISLSQVLLYPTPIQAQPISAWQTVSAPSIKTDFWDMAYGGGTFVAIGGGPHEGVLISRDLGATWQPVDIGATNVLRDVAYGNGIFVGITWNEEVMTSADGSTWVSHPAPADAGFRHVSFEQGVFVAYGAKAALSTNGVDWTVGSLPIPANLGRVAHGFSRFVGVAGDYQIADAGKILTSQDGLLWESTGVDTDILNGIAFDGTRFVAVGGDGFFSGLVLTSTNGLDWVTQTPPPSLALEGIAWGHGVFVTVGWQWEPLIATSTDGASWNVEKPPTTATLRAVAYGDGTFVAAGSQGVILRAWVNDWPIDPFVRVRLEGTNAIVEWPASGAGALSTLQQAASPLGPWEAVPKAGHPHVEPVGTGGQKYFRNQVSR